MRLLNEEELLKKDPIIAPDGYIPNSVLRKKFNPAHVDVHVRRLDRPFQLKPVPKVNPHHLPSWWGNEDEKEGTILRKEARFMIWEDTPSPSPKSDISAVSSVSLKSFIESPVKKYITEVKSKPASPLSPKSEHKWGAQYISTSRNDMTPVENMKKIMRMNDKNITASKSGWDDSLPSERPETDQTVSQSKPTSGFSDVQRSPTNLSESSIALKAGNKLKPGTPTAHKSGSARSPASSGNESGIVKSKRNELARLDLEMNTPDSARRRRRSGVRSGPKENSLKLTNYAVDEDSSAIHFKQTKSGRRVKSHMSNHVIKRLLEEEWMPQMNGDYDYRDVLDNLITMLDHENPVVYNSVCTYLTDLFNDMGMPEEQLDQVVCKLGTNMDKDNLAIKKVSMRTAQTFGKQGRNDVILLILPKLVDQDDLIRRQAAETIRVLTGATDKETLLNILEERMITLEVYSSKTYEGYTLEMLAEKFGEYDDPQIFDRIQNWVEGTTPGLFDEDRDDDDPLWLEGPMPRKEQSFMSEGKSVLDMYDTSGRNTTMYADIPTTPGSLSDNDELIFSRGVSMHDGKSTGLKSEKSHYNARMDLLDRAGASILPSDRLEQPTPFSDILNADFIVDDRHSPLLSEKSDISKGTGQGSNKSLNNLLLKERTLTDLSQVGPLPSFVPRDNTGRNFDEVSNDSAFESARSVSEYDTSHFSEKCTMSHADQHSSKHSQLSEENNMFDVEQVSNLDYEGDDAESGIVINTHGTEQCMNSSTAYNTENMYINKTESFDQIENCKSMLSDTNDELESDELESGKISVTVTPRGSSDREALTSKKECPHTPRSKGTASAFRRRMNDTDGFSTISDRSSSSRKSRRSERTEKTDLDKNVTNQNIEGITLRQETPKSELQSRASTDREFPLPYTLPNQVRDSVLSGTLSSKSQMRVSTNISSKDNLQGTPDTTSETDRTATQSPWKHADTPATIREEDTSEPLVESTPKVSKEATMVSVDTGSIDTQTISKGTPANTPESPSAMNDVPSPIEEATVEYQRMEPISEDIETASFFKTAGEFENDSDNENTAHEQPDVFMETEGKNDFEKLARLNNKQGATPPAIPSSIDISPEHQRVSEINEENNSARFTPRDPNLHKYYDNLQDAPHGQQLLNECEEENAESMQDKDSDYHTISHVASSQIMDGMNGYNSVVTKDTSEFSHGRTLRGYPHAPLSPVKSESSSPVPHTRQQSPRDWRQFFDLVPNAQERKQMEQVRREMEQGKLIQSTLPPISYFAEDIPLLPGEAGTRLLQTVRVGEKMVPRGDGRHRIESVPGKLAVHTQNEEAGLSNFGILQMQWTTGVPTVKDRTYPPQRIPQHRSQGMIRSDETVLNSVPSLDRLRNVISEEELILPYIGTASHSLTNQHSPNKYEWEFPLPPPPAKESRTEVPLIKKEHDSYCKYYQLVKKKLHLYTSQRRERTRNLPEVFVKRLHENGHVQASSERLVKKRSLTKHDIVIFPQIKLGQLVKFY